MNNKLRVAATTAVLLLYEVRKAVEIADRCNRFASCCLCCMLHIPGIYVLVPAVPGIVLHSCTSYMMSVCMYRCGEKCGTTRVVGCGLDMVAHEEADTHTYVCP